MKPARSVDAWWGVKSVMLFTPSSDQGFLLRVGLVMHQ